MLSRSPRLIGRDRELSDLVTLWELARTGRGAATVLIGESGVGKSRLAAELAELAAQHDALVLRGRPSAVGPIVPFRQLSEALLGVARETTGIDLGQLGPYLPALGVLVPEWRRPGNQDHQFSLIALAEAVLRLLKLVAERAACVLLLDDLHEADAETLFVVDYLIGNLRQSRLMVIGTMRSDASAALELVRTAVRRGDCSMCELTWLDRVEVHALAAACLGSPAADISDHAAEYLWQLSAGSPFVVEELIYQLVRSGMVIQIGGIWDIADKGEAIPSALASSIMMRVESLGSEAVKLFAVAALLGRRFSLAVVRQAAAVDDEVMGAFVRAGTSGRLIQPDDAFPGWYTFRHALIVDALLSQQSPTARAEVAAGAAESVEFLHPDLSGEWCQLAASLWLEAGDRHRAAKLFARAGRAALADAAADSATTLLRKADTLLLDVSDRETRGDVLEALIEALGETGRFTEAAELSSRFAEAGTLARVAAMHVKLAWAAYLAGQFDAGLAQVAAARELAGPDPLGAHRAAVDAVHANLLIEVEGGDRTSAAEELATRALEHAERDSDPAVACQSLLVLGAVARERDLGAAEALYERARVVAEVHELSIWRTHVLLRLGGHRILTSGDTSTLELARQEATRGGAVTVSLMAEAVILLHGKVLRGELETVAAQLENDTKTAERFQLDDLVRYLHAIRAVSAAHRADRRGMNEALDDFRRCGGGEQPEMPLCLGLAQAFCSLLEEDRTRAIRELNSAIEHLERFPGAFPLVGRHGIIALLEALDDRRGSRELEDAAFRGRQPLAVEPAVRLFRRGGFAGQSRRSCRGRGHAARSSSGVRALPHGVPALPAAGRGGGHRRRLGRSRELAARGGKVLPRGFRSAGGPGVPFPAEEGWCAGRATKKRNSYIARATAGGPGHLA